MAKIQNLNSLGKHAGVEVITRRAVISTPKGSVAVPDPGSGAFLTPGSGIRDG
jgi:hypothetical protein